MKKNRHIEFRYILIIVVVILVILIAVLSYNIKSDKKLNGFEALVKDVVVNIQKVFYMPFRSLGTMVSDYNSLSDVLEENKILKSNVDKMASLEAENEELKKEIDNLKKELNIDRVLSDYDYLNATVISRNTNLFFDIIFIYDHLYLSW